KKSRDALLYLNKALYQSTALNDIWYIGVSYNGIGRSYSNLNMLDSALFFHFKSLKSMEEVGDKTRVAEQCQAIGEVYYKNKDYSKALEYLKRGLSVSLAAQTKEITTQTYKTMAGVYYGMKNYKMAFDYYALSSNLHDSIHSVDGSKTIA